MTKHQCLSSRSCSSVSCTSGYLARASSLLPNRRVRIHQCSCGRWQSLCMSRGCCSFQDVCLSCQQDCSISPWIWEAVGQQSLYSFAEATAGNNTVFITTISRGFVWTLVFVAFRIENWIVDCGDLLTLKCRDDFYNLGLSVWIRHKTPGGIITGLTIEPNKEAITNHVSFKTRMSLHHFCCIFSDFCK